MLSTSNQPDTSSNKRTRIQDIKHAYIGERSSKHLGMSGISIWLQKNRFQLKKMLYSLFMLRTKKVTGFIP